MTDGTGIRRFLTNRSFLALLAGVLLALSFPNPSIAGFAWLAPGLLMVCACGSSGREAFKIGYWGGLAHYLISLVWLLNIPYRWLGIPFGPAAGWLALSAYLALYPAIWTWLMAGLNRPAGPPALLTPPLSGSWSQRAAFYFICAATWVGLEMIIARLFSGFPWNLLGASQFRLGPLIQSASVFGIYGVSFLVVWTSTALACALTQLARNPGKKSAWILEVLLPAFAVAISFSTGWSQIRDHQTQPSPSIRVACVQPSIPQTLIWDPSHDEQRFQKLLELSASAVSNKVDLLLWPEAAVPKLLRYDKATHGAVTGFARSNQVWMIIGADDAEPKTETPDPEDAEYYNSSFLISPDGKVLGRYKKRSLVIFGEYIPLERWMPFLKWFTPIQGGFTPGTEPVPFSLEDLEATAVVLICFEDIFPALGREASRKAHFLVNLTNNGWFGEGSAQWQHAASAVFRAVENRISLVRCSNNGITCLVTPTGSIQEVFRDASGTVYGAGVVEFTVPLSLEGPRTWYSRHGDVFGWGCFGILVAVGAFRLQKVGRKATRRSSVGGTSPP